ncbi:hypothetical protein [Salinimicrobium sediminilitoris]|uniref:hypothetical protein n=1 Tax=Salinimicrobium sediminilitoris TaxID=2876715 RepID=UPI001E364634|nr:hypothetical protein [Salinimicrobium sediminilitoris]MCC8360042.1 hypothetical protein [Salinimicrobium sediminilitoris]
MIEIKAGILWISAFSFSFGKRNILPSTRHPELVSGSRECFMTQTPKNWAKALYHYHLKSPT